MQNTESTTSQETKWDAIIIGSGMGGLTCAAALSKYGWKVLILEQHYVVGGCTHMFSRKGYEWDVGIHCIGQMQEGEVPGDVLRWISDGRVKCEPLGEVYDHVYFPDGFRFEILKREGTRIAELRIVPPAAIQAG